MADVKFKFTADDSEVRKKLNNLLKLREALSKGFDAKFDNNVAKGLAASLKEATKEANNLQKALLKNNLGPANAELLATLVEKKKAIEDERLVQEKLKTQALFDSKAMLDAKQKEIDLIKKAREERQKEVKDNKAKRDAAKQINDQTKALKLLEKEEAKRQKDTERRKKQLEKESSEYYKLNKALWNVRKETKELLAEMFRMERQGHSNTLGYQKLKEKADALTKQTQYLDRGIKKIDATLGLHQRNVGNYGEALELISPIVTDINQKLALFGTSLEDLASKPGAIKELGAAFVGMGKSLLAFIVSPVGLAITALAALFALFQRNKQTVIDFNSGLRDVSKTTGIAGDDLRDFGSAIVDLSMKLQVVDATKLLEYATAAGQLGVRGRANILAFTEAMAMLETASDISGQEGASEIARLLTLVDGGVHNVKDFGDEIVNLGNNFAATEKEILSNAEAIAQNVGIYKMGRQEVLAYATATKAVGLEAEVVGSTFSRTLGEFSKIIRSGKGVDDLLKVVGGTRAELAKRFQEDATGVFTDYIKGLNNINKALGANGVNEALERTGIIAVRDQRVIQSLAVNGFEVLTNALDKARNANGAMADEFENGAGKLVNQTKRMGIAWDNFVLSIEDGEGVIGRSVVAIVGFFAGLLDQINKTFNPTSLDEFLTRLVNFSAADSIRDINKSMQEVEKHIGKHSSFDVAKASQTDLNNLLKETTSTITDLDKQYRQYKDNVNKGVLTEGGKYKFKDFEERLLFLRIREMNLTRLGATNRPIKPISFGETDAERSAREKAERAAGQAERSAQRRAEQSRQATERQRALQLSIDAINDQSTRKQLSRDEEEVVSIRDKYNKIREEVRKFYADPKNSGLKVNMSGIQRSENFEITESITRRGTTELLKQLNEQKALYDEYNAYVRDQGVAVANEMFGAQADLAKGYKERLKAEYLEIISLQENAASGAFQGSSVKLTQAQEERAKALKEMLDAIDKQEQIVARQRFVEALKQAETFGQAEFRIRKKYSEALVALGKDASEEQKNVLKKGLQEELAALVEAAPEFKKALENIDRSSQVMLANAFRTGRETVNRLIDGLQQGTQEEMGALKKLFGEFFDKGIEDAESGNYALVTQMVDGFGRLVESSFQFNDNLDDGLGVVAEMVGMASNLSKTLGDALGEAGRGLSSAGGAGAIAGALLSIGSALSTGFNQARQAVNAEAKEQFEYQNERQLKATEAVTKALERQLDLINEIYGGDRLDKYAESLSEIKDNWQDINVQLSGRYMLTNNDTFANDILRRLNNGETAKEIQNSFSVVSKEYAKAMSVLGNLGQYPRLSSLPKDINEAREELAKLQYQADLGAVDDFTQKLIDQLRAQIELFDETMNKLREEATGSSFSSLLSDVTNLFLNEGEDAAQAWTDGFDKVMENYMIQKFSRDYLQEKMQTWYETMADFAEDGISESERDQLRNEWDKIREEGDKRIEDMRDILGLTDSGDSSTSLKPEPIARQLTEQTGTEIVGMYRAGYDIWKQQLKAMQGQGATQLSLLQVANDRLVTLNAIQVNTANTVIRLDTAVKHLKSIDNNLGRKYAG